MFLDRILSRVPLAYRMFFPGARWRIPAINGKSVYFTFDDGPDPKITPWVLDVLDEFGVKGTFFCVGDNVRKYPEIFQDILDRGHQVGNHTYHHLRARFTKNTNYLENVYQAHELINSRYFRPPYGSLSFRQNKEVSNSFEIIMWDVLTRDYNNRLSGEDVLNNIKNYVRNGSIVVFHDSVKSEKNLCYALPRAIEWLLENNYHFLRMGDAP